jgi:hypothetical protein
MKSTAWGGVGEFWLAVGGSTLLKGWAAGSNGGGGVGRCVGQSGGERGGPGHSGKWLGRPASAPSRQARAVALPRYSGGTRVTDRRDRATAGPSGKRWGAGRAWPRSTVSAV